MRNYRSTPHSTTGVSPASLLLKTSNPTLLPKPIVNINNNDISKFVADNDRKNKEKMKKYADSNLHTKHIQFNIGDYVLVKNLNRNKIDSLFDTIIYEIVQIKGNMITAKSEKGFITRNSSFFKKVSIKPPDVNVSNPNPINSSKPEQSIAKQNVSKEKKRVIIFHDIDNSNDVIENQNVTPPITQNIIQQVNNSETVPVIVNTNLENVTNNIPVNSQSTNSQVNEILNTMIDVVENASINHQNNINEDNSSLGIVDLNELSLELISSNDSQKSLIVVCARDKTKNTNQNLVESEDEDSQAFKTVSQTSDQENDDNHSKSGEEDDINENANNNLNHFQQVEQGNYDENDNEQFQDELANKSSWSETNSSFLMPSTVSENESKNKSSETSNTSKSKKKPQTNVPKVTKTSYGRTSKPPNRFIFSWK